MNNVYSHTKEDPHPKNVGVGIYHKSKEVSLLEVLDRVLEAGVIISGDIVISVANVDLVYLGLRALLSSVETMEHLRGSPMIGPMQEPN